MKAKPKPPKPLKAHERRKLPPAEIAAETARMMNGQVLEYKMLPGNVLKVQLTDGRAIYEPIDID
jgi:hypothetical protein